MKRSTKIIMGVAVIIVALGVVFALEIRKALQPKTKSGYIDVRK